MSYNILCGGDGRFGGPSRLDHICAVLQESAPDIVALQEANGFENGGIRQKVSKSLGLGHTAMAEGAVYTDGGRYHTAILSRYPLRDADTFPGRAFQSAALSAIVDTPSGLLQVCSLHLHAYSEDERLSEIGHILDHLGDHPDRVMLGDFNALARSDEARYAGLAGNAEFDVRFEVIDRMTETHVDVFRRLSEMPPPTYPSGLVADHSCVISRRIDYVFATPSFAQRATSAVTIDSPLARRASDHLPLLVCFE
ncbi:MAG: endonuclease/exonuclease/phosphatase family protein [Rhodospirillales bacterium]